MILHIKAITGKIAYEIPHISIKAKYVEPPPKPTLEQIIEVMKNNKAKFIYKLLLKIISHYIK